MRILERKGRLYLIRILIVGLVLIILFSVAMILHLVTISQKIESLRDFVGGFVWLGIWGSVICASMYILIESVGFVV